MPQTPHRDHCIRRFAREDNFRFRELLGAKLIFGCDHNSRSHIMQALVSRSTNWSPSGPGPYCFAFIQLAGRVVNWFTALVAVSETPLACSE